MRHPVAIAALALVAAGATVHALPVQLKDSNGTQYNVNTEVSPLVVDSLASGALTDATFNKSVTVTSFFYFYTFWGGISTATVQFDVHVPLTPTFAGFNALFLTSLDGTNLPTPLVFNPAQPLAGQDCPSNGRNQQLLFATQTFPGLPLTVTRKVFVSRSKPYARWLNILTNTGPTAVTVGVSLRGLIASGPQTKIVATSNGGTLNASTDWFTSSAIVPQGQTSLQPKVGYVVQNTNGAPVRATRVGINSIGQAAITYMPTIAPGQTVILMNFVTVQGKSNAAQNQCENIVADPLPADAIACMSELELSQIVNFPRITPPTLENATVKLAFDESGKDTVEWKGRVTIGAGIALAGLPVTVSFGGVPTSFVLNKTGKADDGGGNKFNLRAKLKNGVTKAKNVKFVFHLKGAYQDALAAYGLTNATVSGVPVTIPLTIAVGTNGAEYGVDQPFTYTATQGKSGKAKAL